MKIDKILYEHFAELRLRGEFDTFYAPKLQEEVDQLIGSGTLFVALNLRHVRFINSTALGAIIKAHKRFKAEGGNLVIAHPSPVAREVITKLGLDRIVPMHATIDAAQEALQASMLDQGAPEVIGESNVLFRFQDGGKSEQLGPRRTALGTVLAVDNLGIRFSWMPAGESMDQGALSELFSLGESIHTKFQVKLCKKGYFEVDGEIESAEVRETDEGLEVAVHLRFTEISEADQLALAQFADDLDYLKKQLEDL